MIIEKIKVKNYKTYQNLDLDLTVEEDRPIILIGGLNGGGKTSLFEAICGALYGIQINTKDKFIELYNNGAERDENSEIMLEITFVGYVLSRQMKYVLRRTYKLNPNGKPVYSVYLNMDGSVFIYGSATPTSQRIKNEQEVNKIIKANLPEELSKYFLFDAMQSSDLLKENVFAKTIKDNIENVMGFNKYMHLKDAAERVQQEWAARRLEAQQEAEEYSKLCELKSNKEIELQENIKKQDFTCKYIANTQEQYDEAKKNSKNSAQITQKIKELENKTDRVKTMMSDYMVDLKSYMENFENDTFLSKLTSDISLEVNNIVRMKKSIYDNVDGVYSKEIVDDITTKIVNYLKRFSLCSKTVNKEEIVDYICNMQIDNGKNDPYAFLNESEIKALVGAVERSYTNNFVSLSRRKSDLELEIANLDSWNAQIDTLKSSLIVGNEKIIQDYEEKQNELLILRDQENNIKNEIKGYEKKIHSFDVQVQQEPDIKYDTLVKLKPLFQHITDELLNRKKKRIETEMCEQLNTLLVSYKGVIDRVEVSDSKNSFDIKVFHKQGNEISLNQLNAASKQIFIQVLLKVLRNLGDYNPPVMIDTVMGVLDEESRGAMMEEYFPQLADQTILLCTTSEIRLDSDYIKLEPFISKTYTLKRNQMEQQSVVETGYFGKPLID